MVAGAFMSSRSAFLLAANLTTNELINRWGSHDLCLT